MIIAQFWDYLESKLSLPEREKWAIRNFRCSLDKETTDPDPKRTNEKALEDTKVVDGEERMLQESEGMLKAKCGSVPKGGWFRFLRYISCVVNGGEEVKKGGMWGKAERENVKSEAQGRKVKERDISDSEAESESVGSVELEAQGRKVKERDISDSEAESESVGSVELEAQDRKVKERNISDSEAEWEYVVAHGRKVEEWTSSDSEAEREAVERDLSKSDAGTDC